MPSPKMHALRISCLVAFALMLGGLDVLASNQAIHIADGTIVIAALVIAMPVWIFVASFHQR